MEKENGSVLDMVALASAKALGVEPDAVADLVALKQGMTNHSYLFRFQGKRYIMRIPGEGTDRLVDRNAEAEVYRLIKGKGICDNIVCINPRNGYKITEYWENVRCCDPLDIEDVKKCMEKLRLFHEMGLEVPHEFDIFGKIQFYESLREGIPSAYSDYAQTKERVFALRGYIEENTEQKVLAHMDAVHDNFLFIPKGRTQEEIRLIDWEYAGMQDPHVDIAMFGIYSLYDREGMDALIDAYFKEGCKMPIRIKIYCYIASCGLLWSNWCEYKRMCGVRLGEYAFRQYRFAKEYCQVVEEELGKIGGAGCHV